MGELLQQSITIAGAVGEIIFPVKVSATKKKKQYKDYPEEFLYTASL